MLKVAHLIALALAVTILAACGSSGSASPTATPAGATTQASGTPAASNTPSAITPSAEADTVVQAVKDDLLGRLEVTAADIQLVSINEQDWPDACLGAGDASEACATVITPGYEVVVRVAETTYTFRTDKAGTNVRPAGVDIDSGSN